MAAEKSPLEADDAIKAKILVPPTGMNIRGTVVLISGV